MGEASEPSHYGSGRCAKMTWQQVFRLNADEWRAGAWRRPQCPVSRVGLGGQESCEGRRSEQGSSAGRRRSPHTEVAADVRGGHCSWYLEAARTSGVRGLGGDLNAGSVECVLEVWGHVRDAGEGQCMSWEGYTRTYDESFDDLLEVSLGGSAGDLSRRTAR